MLQRMVRMTVLERKKIKNTSVTKSPEKSPEYLEPFVNKVKIKKPPKQRFRMSEDNFKFTNSLMLPVA